ncbi:MAG: SRPBCC domain-containing protein [Bacteroidia bacterium]|nr:SRPBCC domain-containing protein [Bacteroidia bacterium]
MEDIVKKTANEAPQVTVEKIVNHPVTKVWKALTDKEQMKQWFFNLDQFKAEKGFQFKFAGKGHKGEQYIHACTITETIPNKKLQYSWTYEGHEGFSLVTFDLIELEKNQTKVILTHRGLNSFPQNNPDFAPDSFNGGWNHLVGISLPEFLDKN